jgi:predicted ATPase
VLRQNAALDGPSRGREVAVPGNLPASGATLVGRDADAAAVASLVQEHRLVTVVGPAGVGKTRLALEVGRGLTPAGGVWLVRLDAADACSDLAQLVAQTMRVAGGKQALPDRLTGSETVLLLDNCEHLVEGVSALAGSMLDVAPRLHIITTGQVALGVEGEQVHQLEPVSREDSVALFCGRAQGMRRRFVLDADTTALVGGGMPITRWAAPRDRARRRTGAVAVRA